MWLSPRKFFATTLSSAFGSLVLAGVQFKHSVSAIVVLSLVLFSGCSNVPDLATTPAEGPTIYTIVNHINCELAFVVNASPYGPVNPANRRVFEYAEKSGDPNIWKKLQLLKHYHFVASVLLTLDVSNNAGVAPSLTFIDPLTAAFSRTFSVGGSVTGTQERNKSFSYSVDLANVERGCDLRKPPPTIGIAGELGLADIVIEGLNGLGASQNVNLYGSGGPVTPAFDASASATLGLTCKAASGDCPSVPIPTLTLKGTVNFSPPSDPQLPGTMSFTGEALNGPTAEYIVSLSGSTIDASEPKSTKPKTKFLLSGTMTREVSKEVSGLGFAPAITLVGFVERQKADLYNLTIATGQISPSSEISAGSAKYTYSVAAPSKSSLFDLRPRPSTDFVQFAVPLAATSGGAAASTTVTARAASPASSNTTQFSSLITFTLGLSANGGPNWTLSRFKGPGGGGSSGQLLSAGRTTVDTLSLTFVAACQKSSAPITQINTYWDTIPKCNGTQQAVASAVGYQNNQLIQAFRGQ
jgi:hypothetical protein